MDRNIENLLNVLEPEINKKCIEIRKHKKEKILQKLLIFTSVIYLVIPSVLIILDINIIYFIILTAILLLLILFVNLPKILKIENGDVCYE